MKIRVSNKDIYDKLIEVHTNMKTFKRLTYGSYAYTTLVLGYLIYYIMH